MTVYKLSTERLDRWKAWLTLNEIPTKHVVRDSRMRIVNGETIEVAEFVVGADGQRVIHTCECDGGNGAHLAKQITPYHLLEMPGAWADPDLVSA